MSNEWFIQLRDQIKGPYSAAQLKRAAQTGRLAAHTRVRRGSNGKWIRAENVKGLFPQTDSDQGRPEISTERPTPPPRPLAPPVQSPPAPVAPSSAPNGAPSPPPVPVLRGTTNQVRPQPSRRVPFQVLLWSPVLVTAVAAFLFLVHDSQRRLSREVTYAEQWMAGAHDDEPNDVALRLESAVNDWFVFGRDHGKEVLDQLRRQVQSAESDAEALVWLRKQTDEQLAQLSESCAFTEFQNPRLNEMRTDRLIANLPTAIREREEQNALAATQAAEEKARIAVQQERRQREESEKESQRRLAEVQKKLEDAERDLRDRHGYGDADLDRLRGLCQAGFPTPELRFSKKHSDKALDWIMRAIGLAVFNLNYNTRLAFSPDGRYVALGGNEGQVTVWETSAGTLEATFQQSRQTTTQKVGMFSHRISVGISVASVAFSPNGRDVLFPNYEQKGGRDAATVIDVWDIQNERRIRQLSLVDTAEWPLLTVTETGELVTRYGRLDIRSGKKLANAFAADLSVEPDCYAFSKDGSMLVLGQIDGTIDRQRTKITCCIEGRKSPEWTLDSLDDLHIPSYFGMYQPMRSVAISPDKQTVAVTFPKTLAPRLIDVKTHRPRTLPLVLSDGELPTDSDNHITGTAEFSPDGKLLALILSSDSSDQLAKFVLLQEIATGRIIAAMEHEAPVWQVRFSPDGRLLATATSGPQGPTKIHVWAVDPPERRTEALVALFQFEGVARGMHFAEAGTTERRLMSALVRGIIAGGQYAAKRLGEQVLLEVKVCDLCNGSGLEPVGVGEAAVAAVLPGAPNKPSRRECSRCKGHRRIRIMLDRSNDETYVLPDDPQNPP